MVNIPLQVGNQVWKRLMHTSNFRKNGNHPNAISIAGKAPEWFHGRQYKQLAPKYWFFKKYKQDHDKNFYIQCYQKEVLYLLNPKDVLKDLGESAILLCWESANEFCHRHLVADWFKQTLGINVNEI